MNLLTLLILTVCFLGIIVIRKNIIIILLIIELLLLSVNIQLVFSSIILDDALGQILVLFILTIAAAETSIGLAILVSFYRIRGALKTTDLLSVKH